MLYTLSLFLLEPSRWVSKYEWRRLSELERCAQATYWKSLGDAMGISYDKLPNCDKGWRDGLHWLQEMEDWSLQYEERHMLPAPSNKALADGTIALLLRLVPDLLRPLTKNMIYELLEDRLRKAMMLPPPTVQATTLVRILLAIRRFVIRLMLLPRPHFLRKLHHSESPEASTGRFYQVGYLVHPWYVKPTALARWDFKALLRRMLAAPLPGDEGQKYIPQGYHLHEVGPRPLQDDTALDADAVRRSFTQCASSGCPFQ